jgi:Ca2+-binding EF-hand superfamily protein
MSVGSIDNLGVSSGRYQSFKKGEANLTKTEIDKARDKHPNASSLKIVSDNFDKIDINGDGISYAEFQTYGRKTGWTPSTSRYGNGDVEAKPVLTKDHLAQMAQILAGNDQVTSSGLLQIVANFETVDKDSDGKISLEEFKSYSQENNLFSHLVQDQPAYWIHGGKSPAMTKKQFEKVAADLATQNPELAAAFSRIAGDFESVDLDGDGKVSTDEFQAYAKAHGIRIGHTPRQEAHDRDDQIPGDSVSNQVIETANYNGES